MITDEIAEEIARLRISSLSSFKIENEELNELINDYEIYKQQTLNGEFARQRWALSHDIRSTIISYVYKDLDLQIEQDVTAELTNHNIKNNIKQLQAFTDSFDQFINPFDTEVPKDLLINISSGKAASKTVEKFLLNIEEHGEIKRKTFTAECEQNDSRFEKSIKKKTDRQLFHRLKKKKNWW
ncbi:hypothetical protein TNCV_1426671 [Trichonephila clavipes]|nr:hypothetical protein TNCV_1426671 [Trichonephila clavipes]